MFFHQKKMYRFWVLANDSRGKQLKGFVFSREHSSLGFVHPASSWESHRRGREVSRLDLGVVETQVLGPALLIALCDPGAKTRTVMAGHLTAAISAPSPRSPLPPIRMSPLGAQGHPRPVFNHPLIVIIKCAKAPPDVSPNHQLNCSKAPSAQHNPDQTGDHRTSPNLDLHGAPHLRERCQASHAAVTPEMSFQNPSCPSSLRCSSQILHFISVFQLLP